jgi:hypothetical protein
MCDVRSPSKKHPHPPTSFLFWVLFFYPFFYCISRRFSARGVKKHQKNSLLLGKKSIVHVDVENVFLYFFIAFLDVSLHGESKNTPQKMSKEITKNLTQKNTYLRGRFFSSSASWRAIATGGKKLENNATCLPIPLLFYKRNIEFWAFRSKGS